MRKLFLLSAVFMLSNTQNALAQSVLDQMNKKAAENTVEYIVPSLPFDEAAFKNGMELGETKIEGVLYSKESSEGPGSITILGSNDVLPAKKQEVSIYPMTPYLAEYMKLLRQNRNYNGKQKREVKYDERMIKYCYTTVTDEYGRFHIDKMKPGKYFLFAYVVINGARSVDVTYYDDYGNSYTRPQKQFWSANSTSEIEIEIKGDEKVKKVEMRLRFDK